MVNFQLGNLKILQETEGNGVTATGLSMGKREDRNGVHTSSKKDELLFEKVAQSQTMRREDLVPV